MTDAKIVNADTLSEIPLSYTFDGKTLTMTLLSSDRYRDNVNYGKIKFRYTVDVNMVPTYIYSSN